MLGIILPAGSIRYDGGHIRFFNELAMRPVAGSFQERARLNKWKCGDLRGIAAARHLRADNLRRKEFCDERFTFDHSIGRILSAQGVLFSVEYFSATQAKPDSRCQEARTQDIRGVSDHESDSCFVSFS
jgi:hypothetical protein